MCGLTGIWTQGPSAQDLLARMNGAIAHRGPDGDGFWWDESAGVGLGHRRLAIIDLSDEGRQPMRSASGRYVMVYNGEIYNFASLRARLPTDYPFRGHSDTEVLLAAIENWGVERAIEACAGMFAGAIWDRVERRLTLFRDRFGKKPLYFAVNSRSELYFGSELKTLRQVPGLCAEIDRNALAAYLQFSYVPTAACIYQGVRKLPPGSILHLTRDAGGGFTETAVNYWSAREKFAAARAMPFAGSFEDAVAALDKVLRVATAERMVSDVPLGAFLSGGLDSTTVVALMQAQSSARVRTFSIGFREDHYNEAVAAAEVARHLGTDHTELYVDAADALAVVPLLPSMFDEPFADSSQIPTYLVSKMARQYVTVALSGDGGDEIFCGYNRYLWWSKLERLIRGTPSSIRRALAAGMTLLSPGSIDRTTGALARVVTPLRGLRTPGDKLHKIAALLQSEDTRTLYLNMLRQWFDHPGLVVGAREPALEEGLFAGTRSIEQRIEAIMLHDVENYLLDDILVKVDRASMAVSLEARAPLLDHRVAEFAASLPHEYKLRNGETKAVLRALAYSHVPRAMLDRPKTGFGVPIDRWLRGPLREWAEALLAPDRLRREGFLDPAPIEKCWREHLDGHRQWQHRLWNVLMFQAWLEEQQGLRQADRAAA
jgi:asparagine synthase (glutamine-hydrolysing)